MRGTALIDVLIIVASGGARLQPSQGSNVRYIVAWKSHLDGQWTERDRVVDGPIRRQFQTTL